MTRKSKKVTSQFITAIILIWIVSCTPPTKVEQPSVRIAKKGQQSFDANGEPVDADVLYEIINEQKDNTSLKSSVSRQIEVSGAITSEVVRTLLQSHLNNIRSNTGGDQKTTVTHIQIIVYPENDSRWFGLLNSLPGKEVEVLINDALLVEKEKILTNNIPQFEIEQLDRLAGIYGFEKVQVLSKKPAHVQVSKEIFVHDLDEVKQVHAKQNFVEALVAILVHSKLDNVKLTANPILYDLNKDSNGNIKPGLKYLGNYNVGRTTMLVKRERIELILSKELKIESIHDLVLDGYFYNHRAYNQMLYNDQGGITLNKAFDLLLKSSSQK